MSDFHDRNIGLVTVAMKEFTATEAKREVLIRMRRIAARILDYIESNFDDTSSQFPQYTANLHDATGIAIYDDGRVEQYLPIARADNPQKSPIGEEEWGFEELSHVVRQGSAKYNNGLWLVLFSASSYSEEIEDIGSPIGRGKGFFTWLWDVLSIDIKQELGDVMIAPMLGLSDSVPF